MKSKGQDTTKGIIYQQLAAMALFLQHLKRPDFNCIHLEPGGSHDFDLVFSDSRKIICEVKCWERQLSSKHLLEILAVISKKTSINEKDEILIIANNISSSLVKNVDNYKYWPEKLKPIFRNFGPAEEKLLSRVRFWKAEEKTLRLIVNSLFSELLNFWLPQDDIEEKIKNILIEKIYAGSAKGTMYTRKEFFANLDSISYKLVKKSTLFNQKYSSLEQQFQNIIADIKQSKKPRWGDYDMGALTAQPNIMSFVLNQIKNEKVNLRRWHRLWTATSIYPYYFRMFDIFLNNLDSLPNQKYVLEFLDKNISKMREFYRSHLFEFDTIKIISKIIANNLKFLSPALNLAKKLLKNYANEDFYIMDDHDIGFRKQEICKLISKIYEDADRKLKKEIYIFVCSYFNLIEDEGEFSHYTPVEVFTIIYKHLISVLAHFELNFIDLSKILSNQYEKFYKKFGKKVTFDGWELMGGMTSFWGNEYKIEDRHFVVHILNPALQKYYQQNPMRAWKFIKERCIVKDREVSKTHPDFLNRAVLNIILDRFKQKEESISKEAFEILKDFVLRRKGIPHKSELIYQALQKDFSDGKKWQLVEVIIRKYGTPANPFVERIVSALANSGHLQAKEVFSNWAKKSDYYEKSAFLGSSLTQHIDKLLDTSFKDAISIFKDHVNSEYFINKLDSFDAYKVADLLSKILRMNFDIGLDIVNNILQQKQKLSINQQILAIYGVLDSIDKQLSDLKFVERIYNEFIDKFLNEYDNNIDKILEKFWHGNAREAFVQIAEKLAKDKLIKEALRIIEIFVNDPDPFLPGGDPEDREGKYSHHKKIVDEGQETSVINSVRGWCAWTLAHCVVLDGREYLSKIINLTKQLSEDKDYYVLHMTCFPLSRLVHYRLSHMPNDKNTLFLNNDIKTALEMAKKVEKIALDLLNRILVSTPNVKKALAKSMASVVGHIGTLNENDALNFIEKLREFPDEVIHEITSIFLYYAEFRKEDFKDWQWSLLGLYDDLQPFDDTKLKIKINEIMLKNSETRSAFAWEFYRTTDSALRKIKGSLDYDEAFNLSLKYINSLISEYDHKTFETIYRFIDENITQPSKFDSCYKLWLTCLEREKPTVERLIKEKKAYDVYWWPYDSNGKILILIYEKKGQNEFLNAFRFLSEYPKEVSIGDIKSAVELIKKIQPPNDQVERIFNNLIQRDSNFYNDKQQWLNK